MFENIKSELTRKILELKMWTGKLQEENIIEKGLYFVYAYGIYEEVVRQVVIETIEQLNSSQVNLTECRYELYALVLSSEYDSIYSAGNETKWNKRWDISQKLLDDNAICIPESLLPTDGKNIRIKQLQSIANSFGMKQNVIPKNEIGGYLQELVDNRNYIAHGNKTPGEVGKKLTVNDLIKRCDIVSEVCDYMINTYELYIGEKQYLKEGVVPSIKKIIEDS